MLACHVTYVIIAKIEKLDLLLDDIRHYEIDKLFHSLIINPAVAHIDYCLILLSRHFNQNVLYDSFYDIALDFGT